jgi:cyclopropane fatty-acyl-phospholipid synthase-like methyltransferase
MNGTDLDEALYARMRWNTPLSAEHAGLLLDRLDLREHQRVADLGCGWGELLLQAVARVTAVGSDGESKATAIGVDSSAAALDRARRLARERGLDQYVGFVEGDAATWQGTADRVLCVGAAHAFGGARNALTVLKRATSPGGRLLFADACWEHPPTPAAAEIFGDDVLPLPELLEACRSAGWRVIHLSTADQREWDDFESTFRAGRQEWLLAHDDDPRAPEVRRWIDGREREYVGTYRGVVSMAYLVLAH